MRREIRALQQRGPSMVHVVHHRAEAMSITDRVVLSHSARIEQDATPAEFCSCPASLFGAAFSGGPPMSLLPLARGEGCSAVIGRPGRVVGSALAAGAISGARQEKNALTDGLAMALIPAEFDGAETVLTCSLYTAIATLKACVAGNHAKTAPTPLRLRLPPALRLFDATSGHRLPEPINRRMPADPQGAERPF